MTLINSKQYKSQLRAHHNIVSQYSDYNKQSKNNGQSESGNCICTDYSDRLNIMEINIKNIKIGITDITTRLTSIEENIKEILNSIGNDPPPSHNAIKEETVEISLALPTASSVRSMEVPNTIAFDSLLADVEEWNDTDLDKFYNDYIAPVVAQNKGNLLAPIPVSALCSCTRIPTSTKEDESPGEGQEQFITWDNLEGDNERKRAYIMQFILANRSNSTRALYLTNQLIGAFALPL